VIDEATPLKALVVDDEPLAARRLARALEQEPGVSVVGVRHDGAAALRSIADDRCDVVFLDIRMPGLDGMSVARTLQAPDAPLVVFVTAFSTFALEAFGIAAADFLLKPVETERLRATLQRLRERLEARRAVAEIAELRRSLAGDPDPAPASPEFEIWAPSAGGVVRLFVDQIDWIRSEDDYVRLYVGAKTYLIRATLQDLLAKVAPRDFIRVHRSAAININRIRSFSKLPYGALKVTLTSGDQVRVSRSHAPTLRRRLREPAVKIGAA
jgi:DNA-binding LytR/AlgR family response regulator